VSNRKSSSTEVAIERNSIEASRKITSTEVSKIEMVLNPVGKISAEVANKKEWHWSW